MQMCNKFGQLCHNHLLASCLGEGSEISLQVVDRKCSQSNSEEIELLIAIVATVQAEERATV